MKEVNISGSGDEGMGGRGFPFALKIVDMVRSVQSEMFLFISPIAFLKYSTCLTFH